MTHHTPGSEQPNRGKAKSGLKPTTNLATYTGLWVITMAIATFGPLFLWEATWITVLGIGTNVAAGIAMITSNIQALREADELMRQIQLEAMALALGIGIVLGLAYSLLDITDVIPFDAEIGHLVMLMSLIFLGALVVQLRRYR